MGNGSRCRLLCHSGSADCHAARCCLLCPPASQHRQQPQWPRSHSSTAQGHHTTANIHLPNCNILKMCLQFHPSYSSSSYIFRLNEQRVCVEAVSSPRTPRSGQPAGEKEKNPGSKRGNDKRKDAGDSKRKQQTWGIFSRAPPRSAPPTTVVKQPASSYRAPLKRSAANLEQSSGSVQTSLAHRFDGSAAPPTISRTQ